jgi:hypothetical protein
VALTRPVTALAAFAPVIIDESDGELSSFPRARELGYTGVSSKNCKGFYKSTLNLARCSLWNRETPGRYFLSAEDLTTEPGLPSSRTSPSSISLASPTSSATRIISSTVSAGGRKPRPARIWPPTPIFMRRVGGARLKIKAGRLVIGSLDCAGFASAVPPFLEAAEPMPKSEWRGGST